MARTNHNQVYANGVLVSEEVVVIPDEQVFREETPARLAQQYTTLREWADDAETTYTAWPTLTNAQKDARNREVVRRLGVLCDGLADILIDRGLA
jgi:hypothetical protein